MKRSVKVNYIYNLIYKLLMIILPFVTIPYVSRVLNPDGVGAFNYTNSVALIFTMVASLGTTLYAQKEIAFAKDDVESRTKVFKSILAIRVISTLIVTIPYVILAILSKQLRLVMKRRLRNRHWHSSKMPSNRLTRCVPAIKT